ncbi:hypothetical protein V2J09_008814 [Rumex salicifolius]
MEPSPAAEFAPHNSEKSVIAGSGSGSGYISASIEDVVVEFTTPPSLADSYLPEHNQASILLLKVL